MTLAGSKVKVRAVMRELRQTNRTKQAVKFDVSKMSGRRTGGIISLLGGRGIASGLVEVNLAGRGNGLAHLRDGSGERT